MTKEDDEIKRRSLWEKLEGQELDLHALEELSQLLSEAKTEEKQQKKEKASSLQPPSQVEGLFHHVIKRLQEESAKDVKALASRLFAVENLEKEFAGFLVAKIEAMDRRISHLQRERLRLEKLIVNSSKSIFGVLFTGVKSQFQLKTIKAELRTLQGEKRRIWQRKEAFNEARVSLLSQSKAEALSLLHQAREREICSLLDYLLESLSRLLDRAESLGSPLGFALDNSPKRFGRFIRGLSAKEKAFIDQVSDLNRHRESKIPLVETLNELIQESCKEEIALPNHCLFLIKLLVQKCLEPLMPTELCVWIYKLCDTKQPDLKALRNCLERLPSPAAHRLTLITSLIKRIAKLNHCDQDPTSVRHLVRMFRDLWIRYSDVLDGLEDQDRPALNERRRHQERVNRSLDDALHFIVDLFSSAQ